MALLSLSRERKLTRKRAATLLWDSHDGPSALGNLRQLLVRVRRDGAADELIRSDSESVWLGPNASAIDVCAFSELTATDDVNALLQGLELFNGDLLDGLDDVTDALSDWLVSERSRLHDEFFAAASRALIELTRFGAAKPETLLVVERQLLAVELEREASYRALIEAYGRNGMPTEAGRLYASLATMLEREYGAPVSAETQAVFRRLTAGMPATVATDRRTAPQRPGVRVAFMPPRLLGSESDKSLLRALIDDVANGLSRYRTITVLAIHSSYQIAKDATPEQRLAEFNVGYRVSGFVVPDSKALTLRLEHVRSGEIVWSAEYPIETERLVVTFRLLSQQIAGTLAESIEHHRLASPTPDAMPTAYYAFLQGKAYLHNFDLPRLRRARSAFRSAVEEQPTFAAAHARLAQTLHLEWLTLGGGDPQILLAARTEADAAIGLDCGSGDGHWMRGVISLYQRDFDGAEEHFAIAETLNPNSADLLVQYADALSHLGKPLDGWERFERAIELDPLAPDHYWWAGASIAFSLEDYPLAIDLCGRMKSEEPAVRLLAACHGLMGNRSLARRYGRRVRDLFPDFSSGGIGKIVPNRNPEFTERLRRGLQLAQI